MSRGPVVVLVAVLLLGGCSGAEGDRDEDPPSAPPSNGEARTTTDGGGSRSNRDGATTDDDRAQGNDDRAQGNDDRAQGNDDRAQGNDGSRSDTARDRRRATRPALRRARCPSSAPPGCRSASGRIIYVERVDPDGDGDAHFVLASDDSITAPGLSIIDVRRDLRPDPLPGPGDRLSAAGPVYRGSYGQRQIEAVVVHVGR